MSYSKLYAVLVVAVVMTAGVGCIFSGLDDGGQSAEPTLAQQTEQTDVQNDVSVPSLTLGSPVLGLTSNANTWTSGDCTCTLDPYNYIFTVSGNGAMADYNSDPPWLTDSSLIHTVVVEQGVTHIGKWSFFTCIDITSISIASTVTTIGEQAFFDSMRDGVIIFETSSWNLTIGPNAFKMGDSDDPASAVVTSYNNIANGRLDAYINAYTTLTYQSMPSPTSVTVLYGQNYTYTVSTSIQATVFITGSQISWLSVSGHTVSGHVPRAVSSDTTLIIVAKTSQPTQVDIQIVEFTFTTSKTFQIGDSLYQDVTMADPTQPYSVDVRGTGASYTYTQTTAPLKDLGTDLTSITISGTPTVFNSCVFYQAGFTGLIIPDSVTTMGQGSFAGTSLTAVVLGNGLTSVPNQAFVTAMPPQGGTAFHDASGNVLSDIALIKGHVYTLDSGHGSQYMADSQITVNSYNDATCYAVVGRTLQNSDADKLGFSAQLTAYSGTVIDAGIQTAWNSATHTFTVNPAVGTSTVDSNGYLSGTAPGTTGTYNSTATAVTVVGGATITDTVAFHVYVEQVLVITSTPS